MWLHRMSITTPTIAQTISERDISPTLRLWSNFRTVATLNRLSTLPTFNFRELLSNFLDFGVPQLSTLATFDFRATINFFDFRATINFSDFRATFDFSDFRATFDFRLSSDFRLSTLRSGEDRQQKKERSTQNFGRVAFDFFKLSRRRGRSLIVGGYPAPVELWRKYNKIACNAVKIACNAFLWCYGTCNTNV